jgi:hypothetical protein
MNPETPIDRATLIRNYIRGKDENRPHLLQSVFADDAVLEMVVRSDAIQFPGRTEGQRAIGELLSRRFGQLYDNVYTFCLLPSPISDSAAGHLRCGWLVGMSSKDGGSVRVGCGEYAWEFASVRSSLHVQHLHISIDVMEVLPVEATEPVIGNWLAASPYPWCDAPVILEGMPDLAALAPLRRWLERFISPQ